MFNYWLIITNHNENQTVSKGKYKYIIAGKFPERRGNHTHSVRTAFREDVIVMTSHLLYKDRPP